MTLYGKLGPAWCSCSQKSNAMWFIKSNGMVCSYCGKTRKIATPPEGLVTMPCSCSVKAKATWFITAKGNYMCSYCGKSR